jgi:nucleotide-binding universal stress UspA family protein
MFKTILAPTDGSALSRRAEDAAIELARLCRGTLVALSVAEPLPEASESGVFMGEPGIDPLERLALAQERVHSLAQRAKAAGVPCQGTSALSYYPWEEIVKAANDFHCDVICMASHGRSGLKKLILGSVTAKVLAQANLPVLVYR